MAKVPNAVEILPKIRDVRSVHCIRCAFRYVPCVTVLVWGSYYSPQQRLHYAAGRSLFDRLFDLKLHFAQCKASLRSIHFTEHVAASAAGNAILPWENSWAVYSCRCADVDVCCLRVSGPTSTLKPDLL